MSRQRPNEFFGTREDDDGKIYRPAISPPIQTIASATRLARTARTIERCDLGVPMLAQSRHPEHGRATTVMQSTAITATGTFDETRRHAAHSANVLDRMA